LDDNGKPQHGIWCPPITGDHVGVAGYVEVMIQYNQKRNFSSIYGTQTVPVRARAVAEGGWRAGKAGILLLDPTASGSLNVVGNGTMNVVGAPLIVDSNASDAITTSGGGHVTVSPGREVDITGKPGYSGSGTITGTVVSGAQPTPDPLAYLPEPSPTGATNYGRINVSGNRAETVWPGLFRNGISLRGQAP